MFLVGRKILFLLASHSLASAFTIPVVSPATANGQHTFSTISIAKNLVPPDQIHDIFQHASASFPSETVIIQQTVTQWIADGAASADAATEVGWWGSYINLFKSALNLVHSTIDGPLKSIGVEHTWGISIAIFTAGIRSLLVPLSIQQSQSAEYMKALKPYVNDINKKFKENEDAKNRAIGKLYEDANQNPLAGCFVSLAQLPVFLGLYRGIRLLAMDNQLNEPFLWIPTLQGPVSGPDFRGLDWLVQGWTSTAGSLPAPPMGWEATIPFLIMPAILVVLQSATMQALQPPLDENSSEEEQEQMQSTQNVLKFLPLLIGFFSLQVPAGLTIYWFTSNIFTLSQSLAVRAYFAANPPDIELPEYWDSALSGDVDALSPEERRKASQAGLRVGPTMEDLVDEARFHTRIARQPLRDPSTEIKHASLPDELESWVKGSSTMASSA